MKLSVLHGGIHPRDNKYAAADEIYKPEIKEGDEFYIPFLQHRGLPALSVVVKGQQVRTGQVIAKAAEGLSVPIHAPADGIITAITKVPHPVLGIADGCVLKAVKQESGFMELENSDDLAEIIKSAGIVGMGGAGFPSWVKIKGVRRADTLLVNAAECEPYLTCDYALMLNYSEEILKGAKLLKEHIKAQYAFIAVERNKRKAAEILSKAAPSYGVEVVIVPDKYPQGGEKQLIKTVLSRTVYQGKLPVDIGVLIHNVATVKAIHDAVYLRKPFYERIVTVSGIVKNPSNIMARIGMTSEMVYGCTGNEFDERYKLIFGGPMTGTAVVGCQTPILKTTGAVLQLAVGEEREPMPCMRCGKCVDACVMGLVPTDIEKAYSTGNIDKMISLNINNCIECGCCSYVCPSGRLLAQSIRAGKLRVKVVKDRRSDK